MSTVFLKILNMSISASWMVLAVLILRLLLKKAPKWIGVLLWGIVAIRLICPFSIESAISLIPSAETVSPEIMMDWTPEISTGIDPLDKVVNPIITGSFAPKPYASANPLQILIPVFGNLWLLGIFVMMTYSAVSFLLLRRKVSAAVLLRDNIFQSERVLSPFVLGLIKPKIYLPFQINEQDMEQVIAHEKAHIRRKDHWWKPLGFLILTLHWFNPLMWLGYALLCRDIELACDEKVIKDLDADQKADYSQALLNCSVNRTAIAACPLAFGEVGVKGRVRSVLNYKKPAFWLLVIAIVATVAVAVCFLTNPSPRRLKNIEWNDWDTVTHTNTAVLISEGGKGHYVGSVKKEDLEALYNIKISDKELSLDRGEDRDKSHTIILGIATDSSQITSYNHGIHIHFYADFSAVWVNDGVKPTLSYKVLNPQSAKKIYNEFADYNTDAGGADSTDVQKFESAVSFANYAEEDEIYLKALNTGKMDENKIRHLPIYKFDKLKDLEQFKRTFEGIFTMDVGYDEVPSFNSATAKYDDAFFEENSLLLVYVSANNCTHRFKVHSIGYDESSFEIHIVETTNAEMVEDAMAGWFVTVAVSDELIKNCTEFDADLNNGIVDI